MDVSTSRPWDDFDSFTSQPRLRNRLKEKIAPIHTRITTFINPPQERLEGLSLTQRVGRGALSGAAALGTGIACLVLGVLGFIPLGIAIAIDESHKGRIERKERARAAERARVFSSILPSSQESAKAFPACSMNMDESPTFDQILRAAMKAEEHKYNS
jgi:hypothetical protein